MQARSGGQVVDGCLACAGGVLGAVAGSWCGEFGQAGCQEAVMGAGVGEAQSGGAGAVVADDRVAGGLEGFGAADRVVAESLGVQ